jgi:predicted Rossmann fold flavoprotein
VFLPRIAYKADMPKQTAHITQPVQPDADVLVLGAGPSGMLCALAAAHRDRERGVSRAIVLVDRERTPARKLRASGGGRCNCANTNAAPKRYLCGDPRFPGPALKACPAERILDLLRGLGLSAHEEDQGKLFCDQEAEALTDALAGACRRSGCRFITGRAYTGLSAPAEPGGLFRADTEAGPLFAPRVALALGSPAWPALGGTDITARLAGILGLPHVPARPALTPLLLSGADLETCRALSGLSVPAAQSLEAAEGRGAVRVEDDLLFTHQGLSGPAALRISSHWRRGETVTIDLAPGADLPALLRQPGRGKTLARTVLAAILPRRLAEARLATLPEAFSALPGKRLAECSRAELDALVRLAAHWRATPKATAGMARAEAASGGLDTRSFSPKAMECRIIPGLFALGEALDVAGDLGGFNLHWAWASGIAAGEAI